MQDQQQDSTQSEAQALRPEGQGAGLHLPNWAYWVLALALTVAFWAFGQTNHGFHMHDGVAHFLNMKRVLLEPWLGLSIWQKPGYKYLMAPLSPLGEDFLIWLHCAFLGLAAWMTGKAVQSAGYPGMRAFAMVLVAFQPIVWQTAFRFHSENFVAMLLAGFLWAWFEKKHVLAALLISYAMVTRFELGLIAAGVGLIFLYRRQWVPALLVGAFPLLINFLGFFYTMGDAEPGSSPLYFLTDMISAGSAFKYKQFGFWYNWRMISPASGVVLVGLAILGMLPLALPSRMRSGGRSGALGSAEARSGAQSDVLAANDKPGFLAYLDRFGILYLYFGAIFIGYCLFTSPWFTFLTLQSQDQAYTQFAPALAMLAAIGLGNFFAAARQRQLLALGAVGVYAILVAAFNNLRYAHPNGFLYAPQGGGQAQALQPVPDSESFERAMQAGYQAVPEPSYLLVAVLLLAGLAAWFFLRFKPAVLVVLFSVVLMGHTLYIEEPKELTFEEQVCKQAADWFKQHEVRKDRNLYASHNVFHYFSGHTVSDRGATRLLTWDRVLEAPQGSIILWDSHYSFKQNPPGSKAHWRNVPIDSLTAHPEWFRPLVQQPFGDNRSFVMMPFEKTSGPVGSTNPENSATP